MKPQVLDTPGASMRVADARVRITLAVVLLVPLAYVSSAQARLVDAVIAVVDSTPITLHDLARFRETSARLLTPEQRKDDRAILEALVSQRLFDAEYERLGIQASDEDVELYIQRVFQATGTDKQRLTDSLTAMNLTWEDYFERMRDEVKKAQLVNREIRSRVNVTPEEVRRYWQNEDSYLLPDRVEIGDIYIPLDPGAGDARRAEAMATAERAHELALEGSRGFEKAARKYSRGPTASEGGTLGAFEVGSMAPVFEDAVAKLDEGGVSDVLVSDQGIHIVRLIRHMPPGRVPFEDVQEEIREKLYDERLQSRFQNWIDSGLRDRHYVANFFEEVLALR